MNFLTKVFEFFKIPLENEECVVYVDSVIDREKLKSLKYQCTSSGQRVYKDKIPNKGYSLETCPNLFCNRNP